MKPRTRFCWECGRNLRGNHHATISFQGHDRVVHKQCGVRLVQLTTTNVFPRDENISREGVDYDLR